MSNRPGNSAFNYYSSKHQDPGPDRFIYLNLLQGNHLRLEEIIRAQKNMPDLITAVEYGDLLPPMGYEGHILAKKGMNRNLRQETPPHEKENWTIQEARWKTLNVPNDHHAQQKEQCKEESHHSGVRLTKKKKGKKEKNIIKEVILSYGREMKSRFGNQILTGDMNIDVEDWEFGTTTHVRGMTGTKKKEVVMFNDRPDPDRSDPIQIDPL